MARIVKEEAYAARRNEILEAAQRFVYSKGYEQLTIQDILDELQISKGAFYHYFDSKHAMLEAMIERMQDEVEQLLVPIVQDTRLPALEKLARFFVTAARWKTAQKRFFLGLLRVWYADNNAIVRQKVYAMSIKRVTPLLTPIIRQGRQDGVLTTEYPDQVGDVVVGLLNGLSDTLAGLLLAYEPMGGDLRRIESVIAVYTDALERVLGAPKGSLEFVDVETLTAWFPPPEATPDALTGAPVERNGPAVTQDK